MTRKRRKKSPPFYQFYHDMGRSSAWGDLSVHARAVFIELAIKHNGYNDHNLSYTYREASKIMHRNTFSKALDELVSHGFIDLQRSGGLSRTCNIFSLSYRWKKYGTPDFDPGKRTVFAPNWQP